MTFADKTPTMPYVSNVLKKRTFNENKYAGVQYETKEMFK